MNYGIMQGDGTALLDAPDAVDLQPACNVEMDQALGIEETSPDLVVRPNPRALDPARNAFWHSLVFRELLDAGWRSFVFSWGLQMNWVQFIAPQRPVLASNSGRHAQPTAEVLERSMDIAIGARAA